MKLKYKKEKVYLTEHFSYQIMDNILYLFENEGDGDITSDELKYVFKRISMLIIDEDVDYINVSGKNMESKKDFYQNIGFSFSYYSVDKLNDLYKGYRDKKLYRCYAVTTKKDFFSLDKLEELVMENEIKQNDNSDKGFISSMFLLIGGIIMLCYICVEGAILLVK